MTHFRREGSFDRKGPRGKFNDRSSRDRPGDSDRFRDRGSRGRGSIEMHDATCDKCGKACQVPFKPMGNKPVYCRECFGKNDRFESRKRPAQANISSEQFDQINRKLDKIMKALKLD